MLTYEPMVSHIAGFWSQMKAMIQNNPQPRPSRRGFFCCLLLAHNFTNISQQGA